MPVISKYFYGFDEVIITKIFTESDYNFNTTLEEKLHIKQNMEI